MCVEDIVLSELANLNFSVPGSRGCFIMELEPSDAKFWSDSKDARMFSQKSPSSRNVESRKPIAANTNGKEDDI